MRQYKEHSTIGKAAAALIDALMLICGFYLAYTVFHSYHVYQYGVVPLEAYSYVWILLVFVPAVLFLHNHYGLLSVERSRHSKHIILQVLKVFLIAGVVLSGAIFLAKAKYYSRVLLALVWAFGFLLVMAEKVVFNYLGRKGILQLRPPRQVVLVGEGEKAEKARREIRKSPGLELPEGGVFDLSLEFNDFQDYLINYPADEVYFVLPRESTREGFDIDRFLECCERVGVPVKVIMNLGDVFRYFSASFSRLDSLPTVVFHPPALDPDRAVIKRAMDIAGSLVGLCITAVLTPAIAAAIKLDSSGPVFFCQKRVGRNGRRFTLYKFRSMFEGADKKKPELEDRNEVDGPMFKMKNDPRVTRVGWWLRRLSLDELPQLLNVLKGEMSLVGTRPPTPEEVEDYELWHYRRISIRPGITGLWQVSGRHDIKDFQEIVRLDLEYIDRATLWLDIKILFRTIFSFARGR